MFLSFSGAAFPEDSNFLIGTWVSDKEPTIKFNEGKVEWTDDQRKFFENHLGKLRITFTENTVQLHFEEDLGTIKYEIIEQGSSYIVIRSEISKEDRELLEGESPHQDIKYLASKENSATLVK